MRRTLADFLASRGPSALNLSSTDPRVIGYLNAATERLLNRGHWWGTVQKYTVSVTDQTFTLPPQFATVERVAVNQSPTTLRNGWYEFNANGWGVINNPSATETNPWTSQVLTRGTACAFKDITPGCKLKFVCDVAADIGVEVLALGYDLNGNWIRTETSLGSGVWRDGESVVLAQTPGTLSVSTYSQFVGFQKPRTAGQIWAYENDGLTDTMIGHYLHFETAPDYQRYLLPMIPGTATQIDLIGKVAFIPVSADTDWLILGNLEALRLACMAVREEEVNTTDSLARAALHMNGKVDPNGRVVVEGAITLLDQELHHYTGDGVVPSIEVFNSPTGEEVPLLL